MDEKEKKVSKKRRHLKEFQQQADGSFSYQGKILCCNLEKTVYQKRILMMLGGAVASLGFTVAAGCVTGTGMDGHFFLVLPYAGTLIVLIRLVWNLAQLLQKGPVLREYVYKRTALRLPPQILLGIFLPLLLLAGLCYVRIKGIDTGDGPGAVLFLLSQAVTMTGCLFVWKLYKKMNWS